MIPYTHTPVDVRYRTRKSVGAVSYGTVLYVVREELEENRKLRIFLDFRRRPTCGTSTQQYVRVATGTTAVYETVCDLLSYWKHCGASLLRAQQALAFTRQGHMKNAFF